MGKLVITTNMSLDGVIQDPDGHEDFRLGGWFGRFGGGDLEAWTEHASAEARGAQSLLLGRRSDEWFASRWNERTGEFADTLNALPKYVVSSTVEEPHWHNATVISGDVLAQIAKLKQGLDGEVLVYASYHLARTLLDHDLIDEVRLVVFPVVLGEGERLFGATGAAKPLRLLATQGLGEGLTVLTYAVLR